MGLSMVSGIHGRSRNGSPMDTEAQPVWNKAFGVEVDNLEGESSHLKRVWTRVPELCVMTPWGIAEHSSGSCRLSSGCQQDHMRC